MKTIVHKLQSEKLLSNQIARFFVISFSEINLVISGPILESQGMHAIFQKNGEKGGEMLKKGKIFENLGKNVQNSKIF